MPSPFPGMDPYLEGELWQEFHETLAGAVRAQLMPRITPKYVALLAKRYVLDHPALGLFDAPLPRVVYTDIHVVAPPGITSESTSSQMVTIDAPAVEVANYVEVPQLSIEIRDVAQRRLVTVIEIISPANKHGEGARDYNDRRHDLLRTSTHLLELDLVRRGERITLADMPPPAPYYVYLSRVERRPYTQVWPVSIRQRVTVPVPLLDDPDTYLDVQAAVDACFALVGYDRLLDYSQPPPPPDLPSQDATWLAETLQAGNYRVA